jgi:hypothetical protein
MDGLEKSRLASVLSLFTSGGTLVCCALPALLVTLGAGATLSSLISAVPQLVTLSEHKESIFLGAAVMLALSGFMQWRARSAPCPSDAALAAACARTRKLSVRIYFLSLAIYLIGGFFAFVAPLMIQ